MDVHEAIRARRSIRTYEATGVPPASVERLKDAVRWAPSAGDLQARRFLFVTRPDLRRALGACSFQPEIFAQAPLVVVGCGDVGRIVPRYGDRGRTLYVVQDVAAAVQNLLLAAHAEGLGAVWIGAFDPDRVVEVLGLGDEHPPLAMVPVGRPAERPEAGPRRPQCQDRD